MPSVLIIDDDDVILTALTSVLAYEGYDVASARDGHEGLTVFTERPADVVVVDIFMPVKEGIETIMELRRNFSDVKIIAMSGGCGSMGTAKYLDMALQLGANHILEKPFLPVKLLEAMRDILGEKIHPHLVQNRRSPRLSTAKS